MLQAIQAVRRAMTIRRLAVQLSAALMLILLALAAGGGGQVAFAQTASQAPATGCKGVTLAVIPAQGVISNAAQTEGGHLWSQESGSGTCIGTVIEDVQFAASAPTRTLRVIVYTTGDPGGLTVARTQVTSAPGSVSQAFGVHQVFAGLTAVCLAATSPVVPSPDMPCVSFGQPAPPQQFTQGSTPAQGAAALQLALSGAAPAPAPGQQELPWWP